jgi:CubicO group peptidase (beta-lactamase class C family)
VPVGVATSAVDRVRAIAAAAQTDYRIPGLVVAVAERGHLIEQVSIGSADISAQVPAKPDVQYRIGSITKTVTAVAVMQLAAAHTIDLRGPLRQAWKGGPFDDISIADLLTHGSGLQREPGGAVWETLSFPSREELVDVANRAERFYPQDSWFHYSNLGFALLGEMVAQISGTTWAEHVAEHVLGPLDMLRTTISANPPAAQGYSVEPYSDEVVAEPGVDCQGLAPAAQLWSTAEDLCRWTGLLTGGRPDLLAAETLAQMSGPRTIADLDHWSWGFGLGLMLLRDKETVYLGHTGSMPGFLAAVVCHPASRLGVVVLANTTGGFQIGGLASQLLTVVREGGDTVPEWVPASSPPPHIAPLLGRWWSEWNEWTFRWRDGHLQASLARAPGGDGVTIFNEVSPDEFVAMTGSERGERLLVVRGEDRLGEVGKLYWATYPFTRTPVPFGGPRRPKSGLGS